MKRISILVPAYNEEENIPTVYSEVLKVIDRLPEYTFELIFIDNASQDATGELCRHICEKDTRCKYIRFSRNFLSEASIAAGFQFCTGDAGIVLFSDLQDPPDRIPDFVRQWEKGSDVVYGVYSGKDHEHFWKRVFTKIFYKLLNMISDVPMIEFAGDFRLYDRKVIDVLNSFKERNRYMRGIANWVGFNATPLYYERRPRNAGKSKSPPLHLFNFAFSIIVNFSERPLRVFTIFGLFIGSVAVVLLLFLILNYFSLWIPVIDGLSTTHVLLAFNLAFMSFGFGVLGEYVGKIYSETKHRPLWIVHESVGVNVKGKEIG